MIPSSQHGLRIGLDLGGSKIEGIAMDSSATELARYRIATPRDDYAGTIAAIVDLASKLMQGITSETKVGIAVPGSISPLTLLIQNANSTWLNGRPFVHDLQTALGMPVRLANDANCFALSEATDGAAENAYIVFGVILGTGCGGGIVVDGRLLDGPRRMAGGGVTTRFPGPCPRNIPAHNAGVDAKAALRPGFRVRAWPRITPERQVRHLRQWKLQFAPGKEMNLREQHSLGTLIGWRVGWHRSSISSIQMSLF